MTQQITQDVVYVVQFAMKFMAKLEKFFTVIVSGVVNQMEQLLPPMHLCELKILNSLKVSIY